MATLFSTINDLFYKRVLKDPDFFQYTNVLESEVLELMETSAYDYMIESISTIKLYSEPTVDFDDYNDVQFNFDMTKTELQIIVNLMFEKFLSRDRAKLKIYNKYFTTQEVNLFSPAAERDSFIKMLNSLEEKNKAEIKSYNSRDRLTGNIKSYNGVVI